MANSKNMKGSGSLQVRIIKVMTDTAKPSDLWSVQDIMDALSLTKTQADNALANAWKTGKIFRHKDNGDSTYGGFSRYALKIKESDRKIYSHVPRGQSQTPSGKRRGQKASAKEVRFAFVEMQRALSRLEDLIMPIVDDAEEKDKALARLKDFL